MDDTFNAEASAKRKTLPAFNAFSFGELLALPPYFGWVDCVAYKKEFRMLLGGADDGVVLQFFWNGGYEQTTMRAWCQLAQHVEFALDIGAHTGAYTLAAKSANPEIS